MVTTITCAIITTVIKTKLDKDIHTLEDLYKTNLKVTYFSYVITYVCNIEHGLCINIDILHFVRQR